MVYVSTVQEARGLIEDGPVWAGDSRILTSSNLEEVLGSWELKHLAAKMAEEPALRANALDALRRLAPFRTPPGQLLDFGCGFGFFLGAARETGWQTFGLEPLPATAVHARARFGATVVADTLRDDTFPPGSFDVITAFQVFEHLPHPAGDLARLRDMLKPGGTILLEVPNIETWGAWLLRGRHRHFVVDHLNFFSADTLRDLMRRAGLEPVATYAPTRQMTVRHFVDLWLKRFLPSRLAGGLGRVAERAGLKSAMISLNLGDIVAVIARRP